MFEQFSDEPDEKIGIGFYVKVAGVAVFVVLLAVLGMAYYFGILGGSNNTVSSGPAEESGAENRISKKNKEAAKTAWKALGELNSVASVGASFQQFTESLQSSKIKFDAALRDFEEPTPADQEILEELVDTMRCYIDAKVAWTEFMTEGDEYGFLLPRKWSQVDSLSKTYGYSRDRELGYSRNEVIPAIFKRGSAKFTSLQNRIR